MVWKPHRIYLTAPANRETDSQTDCSTDGARARGGGVCSRPGPTRPKKFPRNPREFSWPSPGTSAANLGLLVRVLQSRPMKGVM